MLFAKATRVVWNPAYLYKILPYDTYSNSNACIESLLKINCASRCTCVHCTSWYSDN